MNVGELVDLDGWLVIIDCRLFLIPNSHLEDYESGEKIEVSSPEIIFSIMDEILPLAGGKSFIFHKSKISGFLMAGSPKKIKPLELFVQERGGDFIAINVDDCTIRKYRDRYEDFLNAGQKIKSNDWLDYL